MDTEPLEPTQPPPDAAQRDDTHHGAPAGGAWIDPDGEVAVTPDATERGFGATHADAQSTVAPDITDEHARDESGRWLPGQSGNGKGRTPDRFTISGVLRSKLRQPADPDDPDGPSVAEVLAEQWIKLGLDGDAKALEALSSRVEGKPAQAVSLSLDGSSPLHHQVRVRSTPRIAPPPDDDDA